jgi:hypothetical protein
MTRRIAVYSDRRWRARPALRGGLCVVAIFLLTATPACSASTAANQHSAQGSGLTQTGPFTAAEDIGLKVYSKPWNFGIRCPLWADRDSLVVPTSHDALYQPDEVSSLSKYANARIPSSPGPAVLPKDRLGNDLLREVNGTLTSATAPLKPGTTGYGFGPTCAFELELTNLGSATIQVTKVGVRLTGQPEANKETYRLIDMCSLGGIDHYCGPQLGGGPKPCGFYSAAIELRDRNPGALSQEPPQPIINTIGQAPADTGCPAMVIDPAQTVDVRVDLWSGQNLIFPVEPVLTVATSAGEKVVTVPTQAGRAAFANAVQFKCLKFDADRFVPIPAYDGVATLDIHQQAPDGPWCL